MSSHSKLSSSSTTSKQPSVAADVSFARLADQNGESSSQAESRSSGKGSDRSDRRSQELTVASQGSPNSGRSLDRHQETHAHRSRRSGGFLLEPVVGNGQPREGSAINRHGKRKAQDGYLRVDKKRLGAPRLSGDSSHGSSPLSREVSMDHATAEEARIAPSSRPSSMDPAQLVQMALELSESRRRHVSGPLHVPVPSPKDSRRVSGLSSRYGTVQPRSSGRQRASYLYNEISPDSPASHWSGPTEEEDGRNLAPSVDSVAQTEVPDSFTPATLSRAEKARKYFELASEHRRLLQHLPPLKSDANAPGNYTFVSTSSPHSAHPDITRVRSFEDNKHQLGRDYNPLQALRNRRLRARERRALPVPPEAWLDVDSICHWVDEVEAGTGNPAYRARPDRVELPPFADDGGDDGGDAADPRESVKGHRRTDTASSVITRPENGWSIEPPELFADTYWTEKGDNKQTIENRLGNPIFPARPRASVDQSRRSGETSRDLPERDKTDSGTDDAPPPKRAHKRTLLLPIPKRHKRAARMSRSPSMTSVSSDEGRAPPDVALAGEGADENTGPLERHMQQMIAKDEKGELSSPDLVSPDRWNAAHTQFAVLHANTGRSRRDTLSQGNGKLSVNTAHQHRRAKSADGRVGANGRAMSSVEDISSAEPMSPVVPVFVPSMGMDLSPPSNNRPSPVQQKTRLHKLPLFRSHSKDRNNIDRTDFAAGLDAKPPTNGPSDPRSSQESSRPSFISRHKTAESFSSSLRRQGTQNTSSGTNGSIKEPGSTVGRFFKGGRIGDIVRNEGSRLGDRFRGRDRLEDATAGSDMSLSDHSEAEDVDERARRKPNNAIDTDDEEPSPRTSYDRSRAKPRYHLPNLPSFISPAAKANAATPISIGSDPIPRQQQAQREAGKSLRFDRLAPPRIDLPSKSGPDDLINDKRKSYGFLGTGSQGTSRNSLVSQSNGTLQDTRLSNLKSQRQRHWSISDRTRPEQPTPAQPSKVTMRDVARVRALLLSSGVKAREIQRRGDTPRETPLLMMEKAAEIVGRGFGQVPRREEHIVASRMLSDNLASTLLTFEQTLERFQSGPANSLASEVDELQRKAADQLTKLVHETSDDADAFVVELTTKQPQDIKRVDDAIDDMLRQRRRQFRLLRRAGFKLLEWLVLGIMWWVWFVVVLINTGRKAVVGVLRFLRWLFSF